MGKKNYDIVIFGATSFVGKILVRYMAETFGCDGDIRWAIAGRSQSKLEQIQAQAKSRDQQNAQPDILLADANDDDTLNAMCQQTQVMISTVGPFALYGEKLVRTCVDNGTDYCDITGEAHWVLTMISRYQQRAEETGARIVHCCGFDSIPSDLGVYFTHIQAEKLFGRACDEINMRVSRLKGSFSGGTYASLLNAVKQITKTPGLQKALASPYCLCPSDHPFKSRQLRHSGAEYDELTDSWMSPFVMEGINTRIVHRSNALFDHEYGENFKYDEAVLTGTGAKGRKRASRTAAALKLLMIGAAIPPIRALLANFILPKPGDGPNEQAQNEGQYKMLFIGHVKGKGTLRCSVTGDKDPGYGSTAKILGQAAVCLARDIPNGAPGGGFWTPARIFGDKIIERLNNYSGVKFELEKN